MAQRPNGIHTQLLCGAAAMALLIGGGAAAAETGAPAAVFEIKPQSLTSALNEFAVQSTTPILYSSRLTGGKQTMGVSGATDAEAALNSLLAGTGLSWRRDGATFLVEVAQGPQGGSAGDVEALIVTAQKREENIQDVPIAISAFTQEALEQQKIEGGFDLLKAIPNVTFSKNNFTSYNFSIRGIGTKAVSATTDPGVAVSFNNTTLLQNRLFEQEYFDVERVEVLRGPQGTLYGRNATAGVINVISAKPDMNDFSGMFKLEVGNYNAKRGQFMLNAPLVEDKLAVRLAGALTKRDGYDFNAKTENPVNGRDLWSARLTIGFNPTDRIRSNFIWERFEEDDDRSRTGKQLCHRDPGPAMVGNVPTLSGQGVRPDGVSFSDVMVPALFSQGCQPGSLYDDAAFGTPNGLALPFVFGILGLGADCGSGCSTVAALGGNPQYPFLTTYQAETIISLKDPYGGRMQSRDLRTIESFRDPRYRANADVFQLNIDVDLTDALTLTSQTAYNEDEVYSFQDFNRFNTDPVFTDTSNLVDRVFGAPNPSPWANLAPRPEGSPVGTAGVFCDPQLGCSDTLAGFDISQAEATQFSQEIRLASSFDGPINFSVGANYTEFEAEVDYYVFYNLITAFAAMSPFAYWNEWVYQTGNPPPSLSTMLLGCPQNLDALLLGGPVYDPPLPRDAENSLCPYVDPNPIESLSGDGHNYFRSRNPYDLESYGVFGELYWNITDQLKLTAGLRYNDDRKKFTPVPSQILLATGPLAGGTVSRGYPESPDIKQRWTEYTGRIGVDWQPDLSITDDTMVYAFYSRGYKGGGANPPTPGFTTETMGSFLGFPAAFVGLKEEPPLQLIGVEYGPTFDPEFVNSFEVGAKNTLLNGALLLNLGAFYYDYKDYQVSQIRDRTAVNENFDATVWGLEMEARFSPSRNLQLIGNIGYLDTEIADGESSIDIMNRTQSSPDFVLVKPWVQMPSNCIIPVNVAEEYILNPVGGADYSVGGYYGLCGGVNLLGLGTGRGGNQLIDDNTGLPYDPRYYNGENGTIDTHGGAGIHADLGGNELPNSPHWTVNLGAQYGMDWIDGWRATVRGDAYWQSQSWARVYNADTYDKLHGWYNVNLSLWLEHEDSGVKVELYAKNLLDKTPITDAFLNSDDTALTTNVFVLDPRLIGLSIRKEF